MRPQVLNGPQFMDFPVQLAQYMKSFVLAAIIYDNNFMPYMAQYKFEVLVAHRRCDAAFLVFCRNHY